MTSAALHAPTLPALLAARVAATPDMPAFAARSAAGDWTLLTWRTFSARVDALARALAAAGLRPGQRLGILARTSVAWEEVQFAAFAAGAVAVGLDPHYADDTLNVTADAARLDALVVEDDAMLARLSPAVRDRLGLVFLVAGDSSRSLSALLRRPAAANGTLPPADGGDGAVVTFSSGTTGAPRPVQYTHAQVGIAVRAILDAFPAIGPGTRLLCWLPLANLFQRVLDFCAIASGATSYVVPDPRDAMAAAMRVRPRLMIGVPRFFERVHAEVVTRVREGSPIARWVFARALAMGAPRDAPGTAATALARQIADRFVLSRVRGAFGGDAEFLVSGSAPMPRWLLDWYDAVGLPVYEAYGVTEDIVPIALNRPGARRRGTAGSVLAPNEVRIDDDGQLAVRGPGVFDGYLFASSGTPRPDPDGWWPTGDLGHIDEDCYVTVTGRVRDAFKLSSGRWIRPDVVEDCLRRVPYVMHAAVGGAGRTAAAAIVDLDSARMPDDDRVASDLHDAVAALARHERPALLLVAAAPFSVAGGELTANFKLRRATVLARHADALDAAYAALGDAPSGALPRLVRP